MRRYLVRLTSSTRELAIASANKRANMARKQAKRRSWSFQDERRVFCDCDEQTDRAKNDNSYANKHTNEF